MPKEFLTINELIQLLNTRGIITDSNTYTAIARESYYAIINGYKTPFLDKQKMISSNEDIFQKGIEFQWIYNLFLFDRDLRNLTFKYLARAEAIIKNTVVYSFCYSHRNHSDYLDRANYCNPKETLLPRTSKQSPAYYYSINMPKLMELLNQKLVLKDWSRPFVAHYLKIYGFVPLWVLSNDLTFGNISHFYQLMQRPDQQRACTIIARITNRKAHQKCILSPRKLLKSIDTQVAFRNICAHDERLYSAKYKGNNFYNLVISLYDVLPKDEVDNFQKEIFDLCKLYQIKIPCINIKSLFDEMGFESGYITDEFH